MSEPAPPSPPGAPRSPGPDGPDDGDRDDAAEDAIVAALSDYLDGALTGAERADVERKIAQDAAWQRVHGELTETRKVLSGLRKAHAPSSFADGVTEAIHKRSAGRFFARRTLGDRVPFGALVAIALVGLVVLAYVLWSSSTGSLKVDREQPPPSAPSGPAVVPPP